MTASSRERQQFVGSLVQNKAEREMQQQRRRLRVLAIAKDNRLPYHQRTRLDGVAQGKTALWLHKVGDDAAPAWVSKVPQSHLELQQEDDISHQRSQV